MTKIITRGNFPGPMIGGVRVDEHYRPLKTDDYEAVKKDWEYVTAGPAIPGGTFTETDLPGGGMMMTWIEEQKMPEQLTRDQLLQQRLWAATNDCAAAMKELAAFTDNPPHAADSQEEHVRYIESALQSLRYNCRKLREYKP